jgi:NADH-quinone oxidoreductase subunit G
LDDGRVLDTLGVEMDVDLLTQTPQSAHTDLGRMGPWSPQRSLNAGESASSVGRDAASTRTPDADTSDPGQPSTASGGFLLASHRALLDGSRAEDNEPNLAGTRRDEVARLSASAASALGLSDGGIVTVTGPAGSLVLPLALAEMPDGVVWVPGRVAERPSGPELGAAVGDRVTVLAGGNR